MQKQLNPLADNLNKTLSESGCTVASMLSERGLRAYFPHHGILGQGAESVGTEINATIGTAKEDNGDALCFDCLKERIKVPSSAFLYAPSFGVADLRKRWASKMIEKNPSLNGKTFGLPVVTTALTHALFLAGQLVVGRGEKVILPDLYWDNYDLIFSEAFGGKLTTFRTFTGKHYNISGLRQKLLSKGDKKIVILNFPNNPTGYTPTEAEAEAIREVFLEAAEAGKKIVAIIDDAYFGLVYEKGIFRESIFTKLLDLHKNILAIKLDGATKEDYVWGFRVGFITFGMKGLTTEQLKALEDKAAGLVRSTISSSSNIAQRLLVEAYNDSRYEEEKKAKHAILEGRYKAIKKILRNHQEYKESFKAMPFNSGYFMCIKPNGVDAEELRKHLIAKYSTGTIMLDGLIRLAFSAVPTEKLDQLFANVDAAVRDLKKTAMEKGE